MPRITKASVDELQPKRRSDGVLIDAYLWDEEVRGFGCKATPGGNRRAGHKVYVVQYRLGGRAGKTQRIVIGTHGTITAEQARKAPKPNSAE